MKLKFLSLTVALTLVLAVSACSSSDDASDDEDTTTTEEESPDTTEEDEEEPPADDTDAAEAALDKIESNFGLTKKAPADDTDDTSDTSDIEGLTEEESECVVDELAGDEELLAIAEEIETADPEDQSLVLQVFYGCLGPDSRALMIEEFTTGFGLDVSTDEADCILSTMISDPATVAVIFSGGEPAPEDLAFTVGAIFGCLTPESQVAFFAESFAGSGLTDAQATCVAEGVVADEELLIAILETSVSTGAELDPTATAALEAIAVGCG